MVTGGVGERVDALLLDGQPAAGAQVLPDGHSEVLQRGERAHTGNLARGTSARIARMSVILDVDTPRPTADQIKRAPKALLHDHLDGGLRPQTIVEIDAEIGHQLPAD